MKRCTQRSSVLVQYIYNAARIGLIDKTKKLPLPRIKRDQAVGDISYCLYKFTCYCGTSYLSRTVGCLKSWIKEHLPKWVQRFSENGSQTETMCMLPASFILWHASTCGHRIIPNKLFEILFVIKYFSRHLTAKL